MKLKISFVKNIGYGIIVLLFLLSSTISFANPLAKESQNAEKTIRIGIIGAENSHTIGYGKLFNIDKNFPGCEVVYVWGETEEFAKKAMEKGGIPNMVKDPKEMLGKIDALIVDHRHAKYHLEAAMPFVKEGIPIFIDKPFCYRLEEGKKFLEHARKYGAPVSSYSSIAQSVATFDIKKQVAEMGDINNVVSYGPAELDSKYGGIFFYGVHLIEPLMYIFGEDVEKVKVTKDGNKGSANLKFKSGLFATIVFKRLSYGWNTFVETHDGVVELKSNLEKPHVDRNYTDMVEMFRTGKEPRTHESILNTIAVLEALEKSVETEDWVEVVY